MLIDLIMESFLDMNDEEKSIAIESMSPEEIDLVSNYIDTISDPEIILESIYEVLASMDEDTLVATLESFSDEELDFIVANESIFKSRYEKAQQRIAKEEQKKNNPTAQTDSGIDKIAKINNILHKDVGTIASNAAYKIRNKLGGGNTATDPVADIRDQRNEIARKIAEANKRGEALKRARTC